MSGCDTMMVARTAQPARTEGRDVANLSNDCEVAVVGAGPYGLAVAAHLRSAKVDARVFGRPMSFWREQMPKGMKLRSPWIATHIADPGKRLSLDVFAHQV